MVCAVLASVLPRFQALAAEAPRFARPLGARAYALGLAVTRGDGSTEPIPVGATPVVLEAAEVAARRELSACIASAGFKMAQALVSGAERAVLLDSLGPLERRIVERSAPSLRLLAIARVDFFAARHLAALELNTTIPAMPGYSDMAARAFIEEAGRLAGLPEAERSRLRALNGSNVAALHQALLAGFSVLRPGGAPQRMALLCRRADAQLTEVVHLAERFTALGTPAEVVHPDELSSAGAVMARGRRFDLVYRHLFVRRLEDARHPWLEALLEGPDAFGAVLLNGPAAHIETKANFALLSRAMEEPALAARAGLTGEELAALRSSVPWTRLLGHAPGLDPDGRAVADIAARVAEEPARFVLKRAWDYGGKAVFVGSHTGEAGFAERSRAAFGAALDWTELVDRAAEDRRGGGFVVQERVEVPLETHLLATDAEAKRADVFVDYSAFCSVGLPGQPPWGGVVRASASPIVNILGGGGVLPVLTREVATALDAALTTGSGTGAA